MRFVLCVMTFRLRQTFKKIIRWWDLTSRDIVLSFSFLTIWPAERSFISVVKGKVKGRQNIALLIGMSKAQAHFGKERPKKHFSISRRGVILPPYFLGGQSCLEARTCNDMQRKQSEFIIDTRFRFYTQLRLGDFNIDTPWNAPSPQNTPRNKLSNTCKTQGGRLLPSQIIKLSTGKCSRKEFRTLINLSLKNGSRNARRFGRQRRGQRKILTEAKSQHKTSFIFILFTF